MAHGRARTHTLYISVGRRGPRCTRGPGHGLFAVHTSTGEGRGPGARVGPAVARRQSRSGVRSDDDEDGSTSIEDVGKEGRVAQQPEGQHLIKMSSGTALEVAEVHANF
jgi:hypothetical protein